jgi:uncharacterized protein (TIGR03437 family)
VILPTLAGGQPVVNAVLNAASYTGSTASPGEIVVLFGTGLGPSDLVSLKIDAAGKVSASLGGVSVAFNGIASPLIYVSAAQIAAIVPYELSGLATAKVTVGYAGGTSLPLTLKIAQSNPGIFSADSSGTGNAAATNSDGSYNSASTPAQPGTYVTFYLTGAGQTTPAGSDGNIATGQSSIAAPVTVMIGGVSAQVLYAGGAPSEVNGLAQINAVVPPGLKYGGELPLIVRIGDVTSQPGLTIAVAGPPSPVSIVSTFTPNTTTISTAEGAPYASCNFWPGPVCDLTGFGYGPTKIIELYVCLSGEVRIIFCSQNPPVTGPLSAAMLQDIDSRLGAYATTGVRLLLRFTYNFPTDSTPGGNGAMDAPISVVATHIDQLAPILLKHKDLIFALEAGFIGLWGEWHGSSNGINTPAAQKIILDKELGYFSGAFPVLVRYPGDMIQYTGSALPLPGLGIHDDFYASNAIDGGTWETCDTGDHAYCLPNYTTAQLISYGAAVSLSTMFAGEFGAPQDYPTLQGCDALDAYSYMLHAQSIGLPPPANVATELQNEGCALSFYNKVGTRMVLQRAAISGNPSHGGAMSVALTIMNGGYGRVIRQRPVTLVFQQNGQTVAVPIPIQSLDLRTLQSFTSATFQFDVTLPATLKSGPVTVAVLIPDPGPTLSSDPAYALPFNSLDLNNNAIFDPSTGYNYIIGSGSAQSSPLII